LAGADELDFDPDEAALACFLGLALVALVFWAGEVLLDASCANPVVVKK